VNDRTHSFGYWLRRRRKALDLTQEALAQRVSCSGFSIRKIEADERRPSRPLAERLAASLAISALVLAAPANAQVVNLSKMTCKEFLSTGKDGITIAEDIYEK